jgi:hypothetical protein
MTNCHLEKPILPFVDTLTHWVIPRLKPLLRLQE